MQEDKVNTAAESRGLVKSPQDMFAGLFIIAFGLFCLWASSNLTGGRGANLGPGSFPRGLSFLLMAVGAIIVVQALTVVGPRLEAWSIRGPIFVLGSVLLFAATIRGTSIGGVTILPPLGLIVAGPLTLVVSSLAAEERNWFQTLLFAAAMTTFCILLFKVGLRLPIPIAPGRAGDVMDMISNLALGFGVALTIKNLGLCFLGCMIGTLIGVLPGVGPIATIAMLLPITFGLDPVGALIMLAGIYYGAQYGGSTTAILVNIPGEATSVVTVLDGHQMARNGRAGAALGISAIGSFFAGSVATLVIAALAVPLTRVALLFGPAEYFSLMVMGLIFAVVLARGSVVKAIAMVLCGLMLSTVGQDLETGADRMTFRWAELSDGLDFAAIAMGMFGFAEILRNLENPETRDVIKNKIGSLPPNWEELKQSVAPVLRGTAIGAGLGILPGNGAVLGPFASYTIEKKIAKDPSRFGKGAIEGVAGPESANNAGAQTSFIPLLTLGIPPNAVMALMVGAMTIHGIVPGPQVAEKRPDLFWGMIASMWIGNLMLLIINLPMIGLWVKLLKVPYRMLFPSILMFCCIGIYSINNNPFDVMITAFFGLVGYALIKMGFEVAPLLLGFVLGKLMEEYLRRSILMSRGDWSVFVDVVNRPISAALIAIAVILIILSFLPSITKKRDTVFVE